MTINPRDYVVTPDTEISDIDLDAEEFTTASGEHLTDARATELADQALAEIRRRNLVPGRKSLTGGTVHSPRVQFRVPEDLLAQAEHLAETQGVSLSVLARRALEQYLTRPIIDVQAIERAGHEIVSLANKITLELSGDGTAQISVASIDEDAPRAADHRTAASNVR